MHNMQVSPQAAITLIKIMVTRVLKSLVEFTANLNQVQ